MPPVFFLVLGLTTGAITGMVLSMETALELKTKLRQIQSKLDDMRPDAMSRVQALFDAKARELGKPEPKRLATAPFEIQEECLCKYDEEYGKLSREANDLNLRWNIAEGWY